MSATATPDLADMRRTVVRIALVQGVLVAALLLYLLAGPGVAGGRWAPIAWMGALPVGLWAAAYYQYRVISGAVETGRYSKDVGKSVTERTVKALGVGLILWLAILVFLVLL